MKPLIAFAGAGTLGLAALLVLHAMSPAQVPLPRSRPVERLVVASAAPTVEERWPRPIETVRVSMPKAVTSLPALPTLATASVVAMPPAPAPAPVVDAKKPPEEAAADEGRRKRKHWSWRTAERDICRGMGKRYTNGGRSWRCRR